MWLLWLIAVVAFLIIVEHMKDSLERQIALNAMSDEELRTLFAARNSSNTILAFRVASLPSAMLHRLPGS